jgi:hypothetical protein
MFVLIGLAYWDVNRNINAFKFELRPHLHEAFSHMTSMLNSLEHASKSAEHLIGNMDNLESDAAPSISRALNESVGMIDRLERLSRNPVVKLSLG